MRSSDWSSDVCSSDLYDFTPEALEAIPGLGDVLKNVQTEIGQVPSVAQSLVTRISLGGAGGLEIATIPGEGTNTSGEFIRVLAANANPDADVMLPGLTNNLYGSIIPDEEINYVDGHAHTHILKKYNRTVGKVGVRKD